MNHDLMLRYGRIPYVDGGDDYRGVDCRGFIRMYFADTRKLILPQDVFRWRHWFRNLTENEAMAKDDLIVTASNNKLGIADHLGVAVAPTEVMHAGSSFGGIVCQSIERIDGIILQIMRLK